jgi:hypothetical protein
MLYLLALFVAFSVVACQPTQPVPRKVVEKAEAYLRSQLHLASNIAITAEAQSAQQINQSDLCQTSEPSEIGFQVILVADGSRYTLHSDRGGKNVEICMAQDAQPDAVAKYTGAGYTVKYPQSWQVEDEGMEPNGKNRVQFIPLERSQGYIEVERLPQQAVESDTARNIKEFKEEKFDASTLGATSGRRQEYIEMVVAKSGAQREWQVKALLLKIDNFVYKVKLFRSEDGSPLEKDFEQFVRDFKLIK